LQKLGHADQADYSLFIGDLSWIVGEIESFGTILRNMKLSNLMVLRWLSMMGVINMFEG